MMPLGDSIRGFSRRVQVESRAVFVNVAAAAHESIVNGSPITGAPGQPVDTGFLRNSWQLGFSSPTAAEITTNCAYAAFVEDNVRGVTFKNHGPHSVALTVAGLDKIVANESAKARGGP